MNTISVKNAKHLLTILVGGVLFFSAVNLYLANIVTVTSDFPDTIKSGTTVPVTITIEKGEISGFGRFTCALPEGFEATSTEQNFKFEKNTVTMLWVVLPLNKSFTFKFNVTVPENASESFVLSGKFSYVSENIKQFTELTPRTISVLRNASPIVAGTVNESFREKINYDDINCTRTVDFLNNNAIISITTNKSNVQSMCKIEEMLPAGYTFQALETAGSTVSTVQNIARFVWVKAPETEKFIVTYKVLPQPGYNIKDLYINGAFTVYDDNESKSFVITDEDKRISESTGLASTETETESQPIPVEKTKSEGYYTKETASANIDTKEQNVSKPETKFFANTDAVNTMDQPSAKEISNFQSNLDIPAPTVAVAEPISEKPVTAEPKTTKPIVTESIATKPVVAESTTTKPTATKPIVTEPIAAQKNQYYEVTKTTETTSTKEIVSTENNPNIIKNLLAEKSTAPTLTRIDSEPSAISQTKVEKTTTQVTTTTTVTPTTSPKVATSTASVSPASSTKEIANLDAKSYAAKPKTVASATITTNKNVTLSNKNNVEQRGVKIPTGNNKVGYKVQVGATHNAIKNTENFYAKRNINEKVTAEKIDNWFKYTIQDFDTYLNARNQRNKIWESTPVKGAFVVAYNGKKRITVQEALMLSNQKWVK